MCVMVSVPKVLSETLATYKLVQYKQSFNFQNNFIILFCLLFLSLMLVPKEENSLAESMLAIFIFIRQLPFLASS